jgi:hypothetical protein
MMKVVVLVMGELNTAVVSVGVTVSILEIVILAAAFDSCHDNNTDAIDVPTGTTAGVTPNDFISNGLRISSNWRTVVCFVSLSLTITSISLSTGYGCGGNSDIFKPAIATHY